MVTLLFPGRHHLLTKFQFDNLKDLIKKGFNGKKVDLIIFAVTSSDHSLTRRNPVPLYLRALGIERFSRDLGCEIKIYPIPDVKQTNKFAEYILHQMEYFGGEKLNPKNTVLVCSTPSIIDLFKKLNFENFPLELINAKKDKYSSLRPYEVLALIVKADKGWRTDSSWKDITSKASQDIYLEYNLGDSIIELFNDSLISEDANLTETRDYNSYARSMDQNIQFKYNDIAPFVVQGKIVDAGCGTGALVWHLSKNFEESDIIGIEATRKFYEYCKLQEYPNPFVYFYRRNIIDEIFKESSISTFVYSSVLHEIHSYISNSSLKKVLQNTFKQLSPGGRIIIRDVVGPEDADELVLLQLNEKDGKQTGEINSLSTYAKFFKFTTDFIPRKIKFKEVIIDNKKLIEVKLRDAYEFISKMNYIDNWASEMHEEFGFWSFSDWEAQLKNIGFEIVEGSRPFKSEYIIEKMYRGKATLYKQIGKEIVLLDYPPTNMILAAQKTRVINN